MCLSVLLRLRRMGIPYVLGGVAEGETIVEPGKGVYGKRARLPYAGVSRRFR